MQCQMKYMGSKRTMLQNGLGALITSEAKRKSRIIDLFCGASSVSWFAAQKFATPVVATDLQEYAAVLARAVIGRTRSLSTTRVGESWLRRAEAHRTSDTAWDEALRLDSSGINIATWRKRAQELCSSYADEHSPIWVAYGGHYYSPTQALTLDALISTIPRMQPQRSACLAVAILAASKCAASPGHTAQPFKATRTAGQFLRDAWLRDPIDYARKGIKNIFPMCAKVIGEARVANALDEASSLTKEDLVFVDPPYSAVHYSRFYHVLETVAKRGCGPVEGTGRYPAQEERPTSRFSRRTESTSAFKELTERLADSQCTVILTFPAGKSSNGMTGTFVETTAARWFKLEKKIVKTRFSTLGGNNKHRHARQTSKELILLMRPRS